MSTQAQHWKDAPQPEPFPVTRIDLPATPYESDDLRRRLLLVALSLMVTLEFLQSAMLNFASALVMGHVGATPEQFTWSVALYGIVAVVAIAQSGWFVQRFGHRNYLVASTLIFTAATWLSGSAESPEAYIAAHALSAVGGGVLFTASRVALQDLFVRHRMQAAVRYFYGPQVAMILGIVLAEHCMAIGAWQWIFYPLVPLGLVTAWLLYVVVPDLGIQQRPAGFHYGGVLMLGVAVTLLEVFFARIHFETLSDAPTLLAVAGLATAAFAAFVWRQLAHDRPLLALRPLRRESYVVGLAFYACFYLTLYAFGYVYSVYAADLQLDDASIELSQVLNGAGALIVAVGYPRFIAPRVRHPNLVKLLGFLMGAWAIGRLAQLGLDAGAHDVLVPMFLVGLATILIVNPIPMLTFRDLEGADYADGYRIKNMVRQIGQSVAASGMILFMQQRTATHSLDLASSFNEQSPAYADFTHGMAERLLALGYPAAEQTAQLQAIAGQLIARQADLLACGDAFNLVAAAYAGSALLVLAYMLAVRARSIQAA